MDPNDPTRILPAASPAGQEPGGWPPPPPGPDAWPAGHYAPAPAAAYPAAAPAGPTNRSPASGRGASSRGLLAAGGVLALLLAGVIGFVLGIQVEKGRTTSSTVAAGAATSTTTAPRGRRAGGAAGGRAVAGQVGAVSSDRFTITLADGSTATVTVSGTTRFLRTVRGTLQNVTPGSRVTVAGPRAADGSITATVVTIGPGRAGTGGSTNTTVPAG